MSKFEYGSFWGGYEEFAVNAEKYNEIEAVEIFEEEFNDLGYKVGFDKGEYKVSKAFVKWRAGRTEDGEPCVCWWLEGFKRQKGSCPVFTFERIR